MTAMMHDFWRGAKEQLLPSPFAGAEPWRGADNFFRRGAKNGVLSEKRGASPSLPVV